LTHLATLAAETTHALFAPLGTHTSVNGQPHLKGIILLEAVSLEGTSLEDLGATDEADLPGRDKLSILDLELEALNRGCGVNLVSGGSDENLHCYFLGNLVAQT
jgi:hypothetical protein